MGVSGEVENIDMGRVAQGVEHVTEKKVGH